MTRTPSPADRALMRIQPSKPGEADVFYNGRLIGLVYRLRGQWFGLTARTGATTLGQPTRQAAVNALWDVLLGDLEV